MEENEQNSSNSSGETVYKEQTAAMYAQPEEGDFQPVPEEPQNLEKCFFDDHLHGTVLERMVCSGKKPPIPMSNLAPLEKNTILRFIIKFFYNNVFA